MVGRIAYRGRSSSMTLRFDSSSLLELPVVDWPQSQSAVPAWGDVLTSKPCSFSRLCAPRCYALVLYGSFGSRGLDASCAKAGEARTAARAPASIIFLICLLR